jgi:hypothetical protein
VSKLKVNLIKYGCSAAFVAIMAIVYISLRDFAAAETVDKYLILCDAFTVPGMLLILFGGLLWASSLGAMDGLTYVVRFAVMSLIPGKRSKRDETYGDYLEHRMQNRAKGYGFLFISGLVTMAVALVFMAQFYYLFE